MLKAHPITTETMPDWSKAYLAFAEQAQSHYRWHLPAPDLDEVTRLLATGALQGCWVQAIPEMEPVGLILYALEPHGAIEINMVHLPMEDWQSAYDVLMRQFVLQIRDRDDWQTVSYAMLGCQQRFVLTAPWYGFVPEGQAVQTFDMMNELCLPILQKQHAAMPELPEGMKFRLWETGDEEALAPLVHACFHNQPDAKWDPRFTTTEGAQQALALVKEGKMGLFHPEWQTVLVHNQTPIGFCLLLQTAELEGNIALIGVHPDFKKQGLGQQVMRQALVNCVKGMAHNRWLLSHITATMSTESIPAIHLYRRFGFQETDCYPHAYLTRQTAAKSYYGRHLFSPSTPAGCCH